MTLLLLCIDLAIFGGWCVGAGIVGAQLPSRWFTRAYCPPCTATTRVALLLGVRHWKRWLPDAGGWFGPARKDAHVRPGSLSTFVIECRRAIVVHWTAMLIVPFMVLWNPQWIVAAVAGFALLVNGPCLVALTYNRDRAIAALLRYPVAATR
ncbi:MAG: hypothetical protein ACOYN3_03205 [Acidimicrobiia bacterium]